MSPTCGRLWIAAKTRLRPDSVGIIRAEIETGYAELCPDPDVESAWTLLVNDVPQSHVDLKDPQLIAFDYMRRIADIIEVLTPPGPLDVLHLGGGAMTLPRCLAAMRPGCVQRVVELDAKLLRLVQDYLPIGDQEMIEMVIGDAAEEVAATPGRRHDVVVCDVFQGARVPAQVSNSEFARSVASVLRPGGLYVANILDSPPLPFARAQAGILKQVFAQVAVVADASVLRGRRYGNLILVAVNESGPPASCLARPKPHVSFDTLIRRLAADPFAVRIERGDRLERFVRG